MSFIPCLFLCSLLSNFNLSGTREGGNWILIADLPKIDVRVRTSLAEQISVCRITLHLGSVKVRVYANKP
jgi:hypothetical protein